MKQANAAIGVGLIGANPERGWAKDTHIPAITASPDFALVAVATTRQESARAAAAKWGAAGAYTDARSLAADPAVDLVVVSVKCPDHHAAVRAALDTGRPVLCEWPLAANMAEVLDLVTTAAERNIRTFIGLQARVAPVVAYARDLVRQGYIGRVLGATIISAAAGVSDVSDQAHAYAADRRLGNSGLSIAGGHTLDALCFILGEFSEVTGVVRSQHSKMRIVETGELIDKDSPDNVAVAGLLETGAVVAAHIQSGVRRGPGVHFAIRGTEGDLCIVSDGPHIIEMASLRLLGTMGSADARWSPFEEIPVPASYTTVSADIHRGTDFNVAQLYKLIAADLRGGTSLAPDFALALRRHKLLDAIERASDTGQSQKL